MTPPAPPDPHARASDEQESARVRAASPAPREPNGPEANRARRGRGPLSLRDLLLAAAAVGLVYLLVMLFRTLLLLLASVLFALALQTISHKLSRTLHLPYGVALGVVTTLVFGGFALGIWLGGPELVSQIEALSTQLSKSVDQAVQTLRSSEIGRELLRRAQPSSLQLPSQSTLLSGATSVVGGAVELIVVIALGLFLAATPEAYAGGLRILVPRRERGQADELLAALAHALRWWLVGRLSAMTVVGILTTIGLFALSVPLAIPLGILAALLSFVPYVGPLLSALPALLIGLAQSPAQALAVAGLYAGVQFVESYLITPLIQLRAVSIPPAVLILAQLVMGLFAGGLGVLMATPAAVTVIVSIQVLYIRRVLGEPVEPLSHR